MGGGGLELDHRQPGPWIPERFDSELLEGLRAEAFRGLPAQRQMGSAGRLRNVLLADAVVANPAGVHEPIAPLNLNFHNGFTDLNGKVPNWNLLNPPGLGNYLPNATVNVKALCR